MKAYTAKYQHGFIYDQQTGKRLLIANGSDLTVTVMEKDLLDQDPYNEPLIPSNVDEKLINLKDKGYIEGLKIMSKGEALYFEISAGFKGKKEDRNIYQFVIVLQEDLFGARKSSGKDYDLIDCKCIIKECRTENLEFFEEIHSYSLNDAYMKTYDFYFRLFGKPSANVKMKMMKHVNGDREFLKKALDKNIQPQIYFDKD